MRSTMRQTPRRPSIRLRIATVAACTLVLLAGCGGGRAAIDVGPVPLPEELIVTRTDIRLSALTGLNSEADEFSLTMPLDTTVAYFTSSRRGSSGRHSIWSSRSRAGSWSAPFVEAAGWPSVRCVESSVIEG